MKLFVGNNVCATAPSHTSTMFRNYFETLKWEVLPHAVYLPVYQLFSSMALALAEQHFNSKEDVLKWLDEWSAPKAKDFYFGVLSTNSREMEENL